jgi:hypothetical protein
MKRFLFLTLMVLVGAMGAQAQGLILKQSTAVTVKLGPFLDSTDGITPKTALTMTQATVKVSKAGATFAQKSDTTACTHDADGWYGCPFNTTDTGTLGLFTISVQISGALPVWANYIVASATAYDDQITNGLGSRLPAALVGGRIDSNVGTMSANTVNANALATDAVTEIQTGLATPTNITAGTITTVTNLTNAPTSGDLTATMKASVTTAASAATPTVTVGTLGANAVNAAALATDAVTEIQTGLATSTQATDIQNRLPAALTTGGMLKASLEEYKGVIAPAPDTAGYPKVTIKDGTGTGEIDTSAGSVTSVLTVAERNAIADALLDRANAIEASVTMRQALRLLIAVMGGKATGGGTSTITFRNLGDTKNVIVSSVDSNGNRISATYDLN